MTTSNAAHAIEHACANIEATSDVAAAHLNKTCQCYTQDHTLFRQALWQQGEQGPLTQVMLDARPHLLAETVVFVSEEDAQAMASVVRAMEALVALPAWREATLAVVSDTAYKASPNRGVFLGYDFHLTADGPRLIEINTNAGGGMINTLALRAVCADVNANAAQNLCPTSDTPQRIEQAWLKMFQDEWQLVRANAPLRCIAIVDDAPSEQYLLPEFVLFQRLFEQAGLRALVVAPEELSRVNGQLMAHGHVVDLVYNRLTDFYLEEPAHVTLRDAWLADEVVLTPHPPSHAFYANKNNLVCLSDEAALLNFGLAKEHAQALAKHVPRTARVHDFDEETLWAQRKDWFFKPAAGYGGKAAYRGDKLTRRVFSEILQGGYIVQQRVDPSERTVLVNGEPRDLKLDLRNYAYAGEVQLLGARLYHGQTTNFRTPGGGFASVLIVPSAPIVPIVPIVPVVPDLPDQQRGCDA